MNKRNRAEGWKYAKISGHDNEKRVADLVLKNKKIQQRLLDCAKIKNADIINVEYGGIREQNVPCIFSGESTKSKTDMWVHLSNKKCINVSIKKDCGGQVYLIAIERFISGYEKQYNTKIPTEVKKAIRLYFGSDLETDIPNIIKQYSPNEAKIINLQTRKHRLVADTLKNYDAKLYNKLIQWFDANSNNLFDFCFSKGLSSNKNDFADVVWYINLVGDSKLDCMINLKDASKHINKNTEYGRINHGSTIQLPFGFVQWHSPTKVIPGSIQFHHDFDKVLSFCHNTF